MASPGRGHCFGAGSREGIDAVLTHLRADPRLADLEHKESYCDKQPFLRAKVRLKKEIVTLGVPGVDPNLYGTEQFFSDIQFTVGSSEAQFGGVAQATATESTIAANATASAAGAASVAADVAAASVAAASVAAAVSAAGAAAGAAQAE